jgi:hypothetical protein
LGERSGWYRTRYSLGGIVMSGCRPLIKGFFGVALIVGAVMSSTFRAENRIRWP